MNSNPDSDLNPGLLPEFLPWWAHPVRSLLEGYLQHLKGLEQGRLCSLDPLKDPSACLKAQGRIEMLDQLLGDRFRADLQGHYKSIWNPKN